MRSSLISKENKPLINLPVFTQNAVPSKSTKKFLRSDKSSSPKILVSVNSQVSTINIDGRVFFLMFCTSVFDFIFCFLVISVNESIFIMYMARFVFFVFVGRVIFVFGLRMVCVGFNMFGARVAG